MFVESNYVFDLQLLEGVRKDGWRYPSDTMWWSTLKDKIAANAKISKVGDGHVFDPFICCILYYLSIL